MSLVGNLKDSPLGDILLRLERERRSGILRLRSTSADGPRRADLVLIEGMLAGAALYRSGGVRGMGDALVDEALVSPEDAQIAFERAGASTEGSQGELRRTAQRAEVSYGRVVEALQGHIRKVVNEVCTWSAGNGEFLLEGFPANTADRDSAAARAFLLDEGIRPHLVVGGPDPRTFESTDPDWSLGNDRAGTEPAGVEFINPGASDWALPPPSPESAASKSPFATDTAGPGTARSAQTGPSPDDELTEPPESDPVSEPTVDPAVFQQGIGAEPRPAPAVDRTEATPPDEEPVPDPLPPIPPAPPERAAIVHEEKTNAQPAARAIFALPPLSLPLPVKDLPDVPESASDLWPEAKDEEPMRKVEAEAPPPPVEAASKNEEATPPDEMEMGSLPVDDPHEEEGEEDGEEEGEEGGEEEGEEDGEEDGEEGAPASGVDLSAPGFGEAALMEAETLLDTEVLAVMLEMGQSAAASVADVIEPPRAITGHVLFVDDEGMLLPLLVPAIREAGLVVHTVAGLSAALERLDGIAAHGDCPLVISDLLVKRDDGNGMLGGLDVAEHAAKLDPPLPVILLAETSSDDVRARAASIGVRAVLPRPMRTDLKKDDVRAVFMGELLELIDKHRPRAEWSAAGEFGSGTPWTTGSASEEDGWDVEALERQAREVEPLPDLEENPAARQEALWRETMHALSSPLSQPEILLQILRFGAEVCGRGVLFTPAGVDLVGFGQFGVELGDDEDADAAVRRIRIPPDGHPSVKEAIEARSAVRAPPGESPWDEYLIRALGGSTPREAFFGPVFCQGRLAALFYGDTRETRLDSTNLEVVLGQAGLALDRAVLEARLLALEGRGRGE